jgi:hypothetical protein
VRRLFGTEGIDSTSIDECELYTQEHGRPVNRSVVFTPDEAMGRTRAAKNFVLALNGSEHSGRGREADEDHRRHLRFGPNGQTGRDRLIASVR